MKHRPATASMRLPATLAAAPLARERVAFACDGLDDEQTHVAELLTTELVSNAVRHASRDGAAEDAIVLHIERTDEALRVEVSDPDARPLGPVHRPTSPRESGWGLYLVSELATAWGSRQTETGEGKVVWFEIGLAPRD